jgi:20S proteasome alpha/beta subunit
VYAIQGAGSHTPMSFFTFSGSGSSYLYGLMDHEWRDGMTQEEAEVHQSVSPWKLDINRSFALKME